MHVYLNPDDLGLIAGCLGYKSTESLFDEKIVIIDTEKNGAPVPRLRFGTGKTGCCQLLENRLDETGDGFDRLTGLCRLHPGFKPLVCMLAPYHRSVDLSDGTESWGFTAPLPGCPGCYAAGSFHAEVYRLHSGDPAISPGLKDRLNRERDFYRKLSQLMESGISNDEITKMLYFFDADGIELDFTEQQ